MLLAACCSAFLAAGAPAPYPAWEPIGDGLPHPVEIDRSRIVRDRSFVELWVRTRGERSAVAAEFIDAGAPADTIARVRETLDHSEHLWSFQCEHATHALAVSAYWATDGSLIRRFDVTRRVYWPVQPDTVGQTLLHMACGQTRQDTLAADGEPTPTDPDTGEAPTSGAQLPSAEVPSVETPR
jgi:hypothetical protein